MTIKNRAIYKSSLFLISLILFALIFIPLVSANIDYYALPCYDPSGTGCPTYTNPYGSDWLYGCGSPSYYVGIFVYGVNDNLLYSGSGSSAKFPSSPGSTANNAKYMLMRSCWNGQWDDANKLVRVFNVNYLPIVNFEGTPKTGIIPFTVKFNDISISQNPNNFWYWNFGNGNTTGNLNKNPTALYATEGAYTVSLTTGNTTTLQNSSLTVTNYITAIKPGVYNITVSPGWIPADNTQYLYGEIHATPSTKLLNISSVLWKWKKFDSEGNLIPSSEVAYLDTTDSTTWQAFVKKSSVFYAYNTVTKSYSVNKGVTLPNPVSLNPIGALGAIQTSAFIVLDDGSDLLLETTNVIGNNETDINQIHVRVQDSYTGSFLANTDINIKNLRTGNWSNVTTLSGMYDFTIKESELIDIYVDADGYLPYSLQGHYVMADETIYVNVYRISAGVENQTETYVKIFKSADSISGYTAPLPYTFYTIENPSNSTEFYHGRTNELGMDRVYLFPSTNYILNVDGGSNYLSASKNFNTGSVSPYEVSVYLYTKNAIITSPTALPITYGTTAIPVVTYTLPNAGINLTCNSDINAEVNIIGLFENAAACNGVTSKENADIIIAAFIIIVCAGILGKIAGAMGALIGAGVGFVISIMLQLIPFWILIAVVIIAVVIIAALITKKE